MTKLWQELDKLMAFVTTAEKGKINEAAEILHLSQPAVTRSIQKLEAAFGMELFLRSRDGVRLTESGDILYEKSAKFLRELADLQVQAKSLNQELSGILTVGTYESLAEYLWPDFLMSLQKVHPNLQLSVKTLGSGDPIQDLLAGKIDFLVDAEPQTKSSAVSWPLYSDQFNFYTVGGSRMIKYTSELAAESTILFVQGAFDQERLTIEDHLERNGYRFARKYCFDSFSTVKRLAIKGLGLAVLPVRLAEEDKAKKLIQCAFVEGFDKPGFGQHQIYATVNRMNERNPRIRKIITLLKKHLS